MAIVHMSFEQKHVGQQFFAFAALNVPMNDQPLH